MFCLKNCLMSKCDQNKCLEILLFLFPYLPKQFRLWAIMALDSFFSFVAISNSCSYMTPLYGKQTCNSLFLIAFSTSFVIFRLSLSDCKLDLFFLYFLLLKLHLLLHILFMIFLTSLVEPYLLFKDLFAICDNIG